MEEPQRVQNETPDIYGDANAPDSPRIIDFDTVEPESLEYQGVELGLILCVQPHASRLPSELVGSYQDSPPTSPQPTSEFLLFPPNPLFELDTVYLSPPHPYGPFNTPNIPLVPSPRATWVPN